MKREINKKPAAIGRLALLIGISALVAVIGLGLAGCDMDSEDEEGAVKKNAIMLTADTWSDGAISSTSGEQWFQFTASADTQYLHVLFGTLTNLYARLYDSNGGPLGDYTNMEGKITETRYKSLTVTSGQVYYVRVVPYSNRTGTYRIGFTTLVEAPPAPN